MPATKLVAVLLLAPVVACSAEAPVSPSKSASRHGSPPASAEGDAPPADAPPASTTHPAPPPPAAGPCTVAPQSGCASNETCDIVSGKPACVRAGTADLQGRCTSTADCAAGLVCAQWHAAGTYQGLCASPTPTAENAPCKLEARAGRPDAGTGWTSIVFDDNKVPVYGTCAPHCDLAKQTGCNTGMQCDPFDDGTGRLNATCHWAATLARGATCDRNAPLCAPGLFCADSTPTRCYAYCRIGGTDCGNRATCYAFTTPFIVDGVEWGACSQ